MGRMGRGDSTQAKRTQLVVTCSAMKNYSFKAAFSGKTQNRQRRLWKGILNTAEIKGIAQEKT